MADRPRKPLFPNPFYVVVLLASTLFVVTALAYCVSPWAAESAAARGGGAPSASSARLAAWLDRHGPTALGIEFVVMLIFGVLAMAMDSWFGEKKSARSGPEAR
jgi:hypothetical protein